MTGPAADSPRVLAPGSALAAGGYTIGQLISRGGFACVYRARDREGRAVAIKEFFQDDCCNRLGDGTVVTRGQLHALRQRLIRVARAEAAILAALDHPNILRLIDRFEERGTVCMVTEFFPGADLDDILAHHPGWLRPAQVVAIGRTLADTVAHLP